MASREANAATKSTVTSERFSVLANTPLRRRQRPLGATVGEIASEQTLAATEDATATALYRPRCLARKSR